MQVLRDLGGLARPRLPHHHHRPVPLQRVEQLQADARDGEEAPLLLQGQVVPRVEVKGAGRRLVREPVGPLRLEARRGGPRLPEGHGELAGSSSCCRRVYGWGRWLGSVCVRRQCNVVPPPQSQRRGNGERVSVTVGYDWSAMQYAVDGQRRFGSPIPGQGAAGAALRPESASACPLQCCESIQRSVGRSVCIVFYVLWVASSHQYHWVVMDDWILRVCRPAPSTLYLAAAGCTFHYIRHRMRKGSTGLDAARRGRGLASNGPGGARVRSSSLPSMYIKCLTCLL